MQMTDLEELRITIDDALELARRIARSRGSRELSLVTTRLEEALMWAERIESEETLQESFSN